MKEDRFKVLTFRKPKVRHPWEVNVGISPPMYHPSA